MEGKLYVNDFNNSNCLGLWFWVIIMSVDKLYGILKCI